MKKLFHLFYLLIFTNFNSSLNAELNDYIFPNRSPSFSNYGTVGLISNPSARFQKEGTVAFSWSRMQPYLRGSIVAYPFNWFEASYQYTDINNQLYSDVFEFSGNQTFKDKGFDAKFRLAQEGYYLPQIALGFRDMAGTGLFSSEYLVASKFINNFDISLGVGWGTLTSYSNRNPLIDLSNRFNSREKIEGTRGGEFSVDSFFSGEMGFFGGLEYFIPNLRGARFKIEFDGVDYSKEGFPPVKQDSKINASFVMPISKNFNLRLGIVRGNTINIGFTYKGNYAKKNPIVPKYDPPNVIENADIIRRLNKDNDTYLYRTALKYLGDERLYLQSADINKEKNILHITYSQSKHSSYVRATGRVANVLNKISPDYIETFQITNLNADMGLNTIFVDRNNYNSFKPYPIKYQIDEDKVKEIKYSIDDFKFQPRTDLPKHIYKFAPTLRSQLGGPDGFYFGDLRISYISEILFKRNLSINTRISTTLFDNFDNLKLASDSVLPHVRTEIVQYLKQSKNFSIDRMQLNYFNEPLTNFYTKLSAGILESMFNGIGGEILYRPFNSNIAIGAEAWRVKQRDFEQRFTMQDYMTTTGFVNFFYYHPRTQILARIKGGRFLAEDSGFYFDFSRKFKGGIRMGAFFALTDISREEFGEGSFDKGFYFHIPTEVFFTNYSKGFTGFGLRPLTRDGAAIINHSYSLWGVTDQGSFYNIEKDWDDFYD